MKVIFAGFKYEYGKKEWGISNIEYTNFFGTLQKMQGVEASFFSVDEIMKKAGRDVMNQQLIKTVEEQRPDLLFTMIFQDEIKKETIKYITEKTSTKTFNWFTDDHWRFPVFSKYWAPLFTAVGTTDSLAPAKYKVSGVNNVIKTQWGVNHWLYQSRNDAEFNPDATSGTGAERRGNYDITFVGKNYGNRSSYINSLKSAGLPVEGYGSKWEKGRVDFTKMLEIFSYSKINLNFTESPYVTFTEKLKFLAKMFVKKEQGRYKIDLNPFDGLESAAGAQRRQIKGRTFEVPACGGFLLTGRADNLEDYYIDGKEIAIFKDKNELVEKCRYYLSHEQERKAIAQAGYERTLRDHTYEQRFREIFKTMELM